MTVKPFTLSRTVAQMQHALSAVQADAPGGLAPAHARHHVLALTDQFRSPAHLIDFAIGYLTTLLRVPRFHVHPASSAYREMQCWLPYQVKALGDNQWALVNLDLAPVGAIALEPQLDQIREARVLDGEGYFYAPPQAPWRSRAAARAYLKRLVAFKAVLAL